MDILKTFEQHDEKQPYIVLTFNIGLRATDTDDDFILNPHPFMI